MARRHAAQKRPVIADQRYGRESVSRFINAVMIQGKKSLAEKIVYSVFALVQERLGREPLDVFETVLDNVRPKMNVRSRRVGGATYQVPIEVNPSRAQALAFRWLIDSARKRSEKSMIERLFAEIRDAAENRGGAVKRREDTHKMAEANRAFAHYRW
ncbi:MAG: 30S ribosomal protein S7 [Alphaproteobacteria bacterium]|nr:30S ribosomal protein S7 [Alphaproteobacteria bacterium]